MFFRASKTSDDACARKKIDTRKEGDTRSGGRLGGSFQARLPISLALLYTSPAKTAVSTRP